jgi:voltage-gated potassium channel
MDDLGDFPIVLTLAVGLAFLVAMGAWEIRQIMEAKLPMIRATQSLAGYVPLFLVLFATCYYLMARDDPSNFNIEPLTKTDTLYFTVTVFSTVGFGDINATSEIARIVVMVQIVLDLVLLGVGVRLLTQAVQVGETRRQEQQDPSASQST